MYSKPWYKSRTIWLTALWVSYDVADYLLGHPDVLKGIGLSDHAADTIVVALNLWLRFRTSTGILPIGAK
jgi:hypothetical protein